MENKRSVDRPTHASMRAHQRQFAWQILVPFLVMAGLIVAGAVLAVTGKTPGSRVLADVSVIWLLAPMLFFALAILVFVITIIYGMAKLLQLLPRYTGKAQGIFTRISTGTRQAANGAAKPIVWFRQAGAVIKSIFKLK